MAGRKARELTLDEIKAIRASPDGIQKLARQYGIGHARMTAIKQAATLDEALKFRKAMPPKATGELKPGEAREVVAMEARKPAPVIFRLGEAEIRLEPQCLYEAYLLYQDTKIKCGLTDDFSTFILDAAGLVWRILVPQSKTKEGEIE